MTARMLLDGSKLRQAREAKGLSRSRLSAVTAQRGRYVSGEAIERIEIAGTSASQSDVIWSLADALELEVAELMTRVEE